MANTPLPEHLRIKSTMLVGGEFPGEGSHLIDLFVIANTEVYLSKLGLEIDGMSNPVIINIAAKDRAKDFLKLSQQEAQTDHLYILGVPGFARPPGILPIVDETDVRQASRIITSGHSKNIITLGVSDLHTKANWTASVALSNPKIFTVHGEMLDDPPLPNGYVTLDGGVHIRANYLSAICPFLSSRCELVLRAVEAGVYHPAGMSMRGEPIQHSANV